MDVYHFSEQPYAPGLGASTQSLRITLPNSHLDPQQAADILNYRLDEWQLCDELGINIMTNEHHSTATCISPSSLIPIAMMARQTSHVRLLPLGVPLGIREDPVRVAEEISYIDLVSRGRLEIGLVKGAPYELAAASVGPAGMQDRFWDAHDLLVKALTTHDGPFDWESEWFNYRQVNIWPRPYQQPIPRIWITGSSPESCAAVARRGHVFATILAGWNSRALFDTYRRIALELGRPIPTADRFGYLLLMGVGDTEAEGHRRLHEVAGYLRTTSIVGEAFMNPPGYMSPEGNAAWLKRNQLRGRSSTTGHHFKAATRDGREIAVGSGAGSAEGVTPQDLIDAAVAVAGTADQVYQQIVEISEHVGGIGNLLVMGHGGSMTHEDAVANLTLFGTEVLPRLKEYDADIAAVKAGDRVSDSICEPAAG